MITIIYRLIVVMFILLIVKDLFKEKEFKLQMNVALVIVPLILRALMIIVACVGLGKSYIEAYVE